jgi:hypothetical protein
MEKYPKYNVMTRNGTMVRMNDAALRIAEKHFGINRQRGMNHEVPPEILQLPKRIDIIKAEVKVQPAVKEEIDEKAIEHDIAMDVIKKARKAPVRSKSK